MQSRTSFFNKTLFAKTLSRYWPLWGCASLAGAMIPLVLLLNLLGAYSHTLTTTEVQEMLYGALCYGVPVITLFYAILVAVTVWNYLFNARSVGLMHTLPLDRGSLFLTGLASGMAMLLIPYVVTGGLTILIALFNGALPVLSVLETIVGVIGISVFYFATATFCAMVTGNLFAMPCFYFIGHFFFYVLYWMLSQFATNFIFGYNNGSNVPALVQFLTPTVNFYEILDFETHYNDTTHVIESVTLEGLWLIIVYALIGLTLLALSFYLYRLRHSESAGDVVAFDWLKPLFRYGVALCASLTLGQVLYEILWQVPFQHGRYYQIVPMGACMILAGLIGYYAASMLLAKSLRVFRRSLPGIATVCALVVIICAGVAMDIFGVAARLPDKSDVARLQINISGENMTITPDNPLYDQMVTIQRTIIADEKYIRATEQEIAAIQNRGDKISEFFTDTNVVYARFNYYLQDGDVVYRQYRIPITRERWEQVPSSYDYQLNRFFNNPDTIRYRLHGGKSEIANLWVNLYTGEFHYNEQVEGAARENVWRALQEDALAGNFMRVDLIGGTKPMEELGNLEIEFRIPNSTYDSYGGHDSFYYDYQYYPITASMTHTLRALVDNGVISAEQYEALLIYGSDISTGKEVLTSFPEASYGIIGGADGPTSVFVTTAVE